MNDDAAGQGPHERPVGRPVDEATDTSGPRGTYGCACLDRDSVQCAAIRYGMDHYGGHRNSSGFSVSFAQAQAFELLPDCDPIG